MKSALVVLLSIMVVSLNAHLPSPVDHQADMIGDADRLRSVVAACDGFDRPRFVPDENCFAQMNDYFLTQPPWNYDHLMLYEMYSSQPRAHYSVYDSILLRHGPESPSKDRIPLWKNIFDGEFSKRASLVHEVFQDEVCKNLRESVRVRPDLASRCKSRELFKYAAYHDVCDTGMARAKQWLKIRHDDPSNNGQSHHEKALESLKRNFDRFNWRDGASFEQVAARFTESILQIAWTVHHCQGPVVDYSYNSNLEPIVPNLDEEGISSIRRIVAISRVGYEAALHIAAMTGDDWALRRFKPRRNDDALPYWKAVAEFQPSFAHRYLATWGRGFSLSHEQKQWHAIKAFALARATAADKAFSLEEYSQAVFRSEELLVGSALEQLLSTIGMTEYEVFANQKWLDEHLVYPWQE
ncbi:MAG: hypothetical protein OXG24_14035 [Gammaproteobacteria bacterium]|nr:hypothetical protein [Gammaproteobacteria bacterium]